LSFEEQERAARVAALRALSVLASELKEHERVALKKLTVFVMSGTGFLDHSKVADGASRLFLDVLGDQGEHCRTAVGVPSLPSGGAIELDLICSLLVGGG
jgi:enamine deaminase RidA (YjgF/YER057c/UK114 family)